LLVKTTIDGTMEYCANWLLEIYCKGGTKNLCSPACKIPSQMALNHCADQLLKNCAEKLVKNHHRTEPTLGSLWKAKVDGTVIETISVAQLPKMACDLSYSQKDYISNFEFNERIPIYYFVVLEPPDRIQYLESTYELSDIFCSGWIFNILIRFSFSIFFLIIPLSIPRCP
jgi:hypothetical protein